MGGPGSESNRDYQLGRVLVAGCASRWASTLHEGLRSAGLDAVGCDPEDRAAFERFLPDLVVVACDLVEPETLAFCRWIRARSSIPVVLVVSQPGRDDVVAALDSGADMVLGAPIRQRELAARVRALLRRHPPRQVDLATIVTHGDLRLDRDRGRLELPGGALELAGTDFKLMELLVLAAPKVVPRNEMQRALGVDGAVLDGLMRQLRGRVEAVEGWRRILAVRGVGFRILAGDPAGEARRGGPPPVIDLRPPAPGEADQAGSTGRDLEEGSDGSDGLVLA